MKKIIAILPVIFIWTCTSFAYSNENDREESFKKLREEVIRLLVVNPGSSGLGKYIGYSFEISYGEEIRIKFSENTPWNILYNSRRIDKQNVNIAKKKLKEFIEKEGISIMKDQVILYSVVHIWEGDIYEWEDNLEQVVEQLFDEGKNYHESSLIRIEKPIVVSKLLLPSK